MLRLSCSSVLLLVSSRDRRRHRRYSCSARGSITGRRRRGLSVGRRRRWRRRRRRWRRRTCLMILTRPRINRSFARSTYGTRTIDSIRGLGHPWFHRSVFPERYRSVTFAPGKNRKRDDDTVATTYSLRRTPPRLGKSSKTVRTTRQFCNRCIPLRVYRFYATLLMNKKCVTLIFEFTVYEIKKCISR